MRIYYEVISSIGGDNSVIERKDVSSMTGQERADTLAVLKAEYGDSCTYRQHSCRHDDGLPCELLGPL